MPSRRVLLAVFLCSLLGCVPASARSATPPLVWQEAARLQILCIVASDSRDRMRVQADLCERVRKIASRGASIPVSTLDIGDPAILAPGAVTLLVHASVRPATGNRLLAFSIRPYRVSADQSGPFFGSAPRAIAMTDPAALDDALTEALSETLPWRPKLDGPRPLQ